ncbi:hypothetical protein HNO52_02085 [Billgrantia diversa]|uniref:hypothetical protein n=1 Tax=Halomonas sp. MCCC 1A13316 TaxID=2733487 RepID=UPI0018A612E2|nr:hypothetical protein [Halomonas sp. MCCC 1A13316]QOR37435.1 hypothetical protein HNO52_02085 [Halomonas sp. MCCC 1A13316]
MKPQHYLQQYRQYRESLDWESAEQALVEGIEAFPIHSELYQERTALLLNRQRYPEAEAALNAWYRAVPTLEKQPPRITRYLLASRVYRELAASPIVQTAVTHLLAAVQQETPTGERALPILRHLVALVGKVENQALLAVCLEVAYKCSPNPAMYTVMEQLLHQIGDEQTLRKFWQYWLAHANQDCEIHAYVVYNAWLGASLDQVTASFAALDGQLGRLSSDGLFRLVAVQLATGSARFDTTELHDAVTQQLFGDIPMGHRLRYIEALWQWNHPAQAEQALQAAELMEMPRPDHRLQIEAIRRQWGLERSLGVVGTPSLFEDHDQEVACHWDPRSDKVLIVFTGAGERTGIRLELMHAILTNEPLNVIYLKDRQRLLYLNGIKQLGGSLEASVETLKAMVPSHAKRILCYGNSGGSFAAVLYGHKLGAEKILCMGGITDLRVKTMQQDGRAKVIAERILKMTPQYAVSLRSLLENKHSMTLWMVYGDCDERDENYASHVKGLPGVRLLPVEGCDDHNVTGWLLSRGTLLALMVDFLKTAHCD